MKLKLYNQLTKNIDTFNPINEGKVSLYTCGPTVYSYPTVGNWAAYIYWDTLVRLLNQLDYKVTRVMNITDVGHLVSDEDSGEDKLEKGARREGKTAQEIADFYTGDFIDGMSKLNIIEPNHMPRATQFIDEQLALVRVLKEKGFTYVISDGIYFNTALFPEYGDFAGLNIEAQKAGARVEYNPEKKNPSDFALWKFTPTGEKRDMEWETPSDLLDGSADVMGFPGWHLECSSMAMTILGETIDIHTGGIDHIPVHHTNEIAQSQAASGKRFANYWLHNNHMKVDGTKISKSLGNGYTLQDLNERGFSPLDLRLLVLQSQYRTEGNFTFENLTAAKNRRHNWRNVAALRHQTHDTIYTDTQSEASSSTGYLYAAIKALTEALSSDLNTPAALTLVNEAFSSMQDKPLSDIHQHALISFLETVDNLLGLDLIDTTPDLNDDQKRLIVERSRAREQKDYEKSDGLRSELEETGITVRDTPYGAVWEYTN